MLVLSHIFKKFLLIHNDLLRLIYMTEKNLKSLEILKQFPCFLHVLLVSFIRIPQQRQNERHILEIRLQLKKKCF